MTADAAGNWNDGGCVILTPNPGSNSYSCADLKGCVTALVMYNVSNADHDISVVIGTNCPTPPQTVTVPGTTGGQGLATIVVINGAVISAVTLSMNASQNGDSKIKAFLASLALPQSGITNTQLPADGRQNPFPQFTRFFYYLACAWYGLILKNTATQFLCAQFGPDPADMTLYCVNPGPDARLEKYIVQLDAANPGPVRFVTPSPSGSKQILLQDIPCQNGKQLVWVNVDSASDSQNALISFMRTS